MAGDWIKMRMNLRTHPKVVRMASALKADRFRIVGGLHAVWCLADEHTEDGRLPGYSVPALDDSIGWPGFGAALKAVDWLEENEQGLVIPRFDEHNGASAKRRAMDSERKRREREVLNLSAPEADETVTREEKRREELKPTPTTVGGSSVLEILPSNIPYKEIVALFNEIMEKLPKVREMTNKRRALVRTAWFVNKNRRSVNFWKSYFEECQEDNFLNGTGPYSKGHENWEPTFDYLLRAEVVTKVYEKAMHRLEQRA
jgi:hypothetical protein